MTFTITMGWWLVPLAITVATFGGFAVWSISQPPASGYDSIGAGIAAAMVFLLATVVSLVAWLVWAVLT